MATDLERLIVQLEANMRNYDRSMQRAGLTANRAAKRIEDRFEQANGRLNRTFAAMQRGAVAAFGAIGVAVGGAQLAQFSLEALQAAETLADTADRVGFATDRLQELRYAADQNGSSVRTLDMALQRFSRRLGEAANGGGELLGSLRETGIALRDGEGRMRSSYDILLDYADAIQAAESDQRALSLAFKAFDSEGASLVTLLRQGREGVQQWGSAAREAGLVLENGLVRQGAEANRVLRTMGQQVNAEATRAVLENAEGLEGLGQALADIALWGIRAAGAIGTFYQEMIQGETPGERLQAMRNELRLINGEIEEQRRRLSTGAGATSGALSDLAENEVRRAEILQAIDMAEQRAAQLAAMRGATPESVAASGSPGTSSSTSANPFDPYAGKTKPAPASEISKGAALAAEKEAAQELGMAQAEAYAEAINQRRDDFSREFASVMAGGFRAAFEGDLPEYAAKRLQDALYNRLFGLFEDLGQQLFKSMQGGKGGGFLSTVGSAVFGGFRASGGPVSAGTAYRVGERGPETFVPTQPGMILPNAATQPFQAASAPANVQVSFQPQMINATGIPLKLDFVTKDQVRVMIDDRAPRTVADQFGNPNSPVSRAVTQSFSVRPARGNV